MITGELIIARKQISIIFSRNSIILDQGFYMKKKWGAGAGRKHKKSESKCKRADCHSYGRDEVNDGICKCLLEFLKL